VVRDSGDDLEALRGSPLLTMSELAARGYSRMKVKRLHETGRLEKVAYGIYRLPEAEDDSRLLWAAVSAKHPYAVFCLESAAAFHGITQNMAPRLNIAIPAGYRPFSLESAGVAVDFVKLKGGMLDFGIVETEIAGVKVKITDAARTVSDMFRFSSLNRYQKRDSIRIDVETFHDALSRYLEREGVSEGASKIRKVTDKRLWNELGPHVQMMARSMERSPAV